MRRIQCLVLALAVSACMGYAFAQSSDFAQSGGFAIDDSTLTPMATLIGGAFVLEGHIGQPIAGKSSAGSFQLIGGFTPMNTSRIFANGFEP